MDQNAVYARLWWTRLLVAALGERLVDPWWRSSFLLPTGMRYGQRIFPRSFLKAALTSATVAACRDHDASIGRRSFHLFRFPQYIERQLVGLEGELENSQVPDNLDTLLSELAAIQADIHVSGASGPKSLGQIDAVKKATTPAMLASLYLAAVHTGKRVYPYFEAEGDE
jgi:hypothetical protein